MKKRFLLPLILISAAMLTLSACGLFEQPPTGTEKVAVLDKTELTLCVGAQDTLTLYWTEEGSDVLFAEIGGAIEYRWESSDEETVTLTAEEGTATVTAVAEGTAVVTVYEGEKALASCNVTVVTSPLSVTVPEGKLVVRNGQVVTVRVKSAIPLTGEYEWSVSDAAIAKVESQGDIAMITATKRGECTVTVANGVYTTSFTFIVGIN